MDPIESDENSSLSLVDQGQRDENDEYLTESQEIVFTDGSSLTTADGEVIVDHVAKLISLVYGYPALYNKQSANYKNSNIRENCWLEIGFQLNKSAVECSKRWSQLRDSYSREKRRKAEETKSGSGATKRKGFHLYNSMQFLEKHIQKRKTFTNATVSTTPPAIRTPFKPIYMKNCAMSTPISYASTSVPRSLFARSLPSVASISPAPMSLTTLSVRRPISPLSLQPQSPNSPTPPATVLPGTLILDTPTPSPPHTPTPSLTTTPTLASHTAGTHATMSRPSSTLSSYSTFSTCTDASSASSSFDVNDNVLYDMDLDFKIPEENSRSTFSRNVVNERSPSQQEATYIASSINTKFKENIKSPGHHLQPKACYNKDSGKRQKVDPIEVSFLNLSSALQGHFQNAAPKEKELKNLTAEQTFANLIASELEAMPEPLKATKKARLMQVLFE